MFKNALCLWLKSHGLTQAECDQVCADKRVALSLRLEDSGGMLNDVHDALYRIRSDAGTAAARALNDAGEQVLLMQHLKNHVAGKPATASAPPVPQLSPREALLQRICRELELNRTEFKLLHEALA